MGGRVRPGHDDKGHVTRRCAIGGPRWPVNPIGIEYDPDDWLAKLRSGTPASSFLAREGDLPVSPIRGALEG